eukprot:6209284-Pleurochrysis_carterae.AAC.4
MITFSLYQNKARINFKADVKLILRAQRKSCNVLTVAAMVSRLVGVQTSLQMLIAFVLNQTTLQIELFRLESSRLVAARFDWTSSGHRSISWLVFIQLHHNSFITMMSSAAPSPSYSATRLFTSKQGRFENLAQ